MTLVYPPGDFTGFLTAILGTWVHRNPGWAVVPGNPDWFGPEGPRRSVEPDQKAALRIWSGLRNLAGPGAALALADAFRHRDPGKEALLAEFIRLCVLYGPGTLGRLGDPIVRETLRRVRAVRSEAHRYLGLVRFQTMAGGGWYGRFEPDHDVLGLLVGSFGQRLADQDWMLHDVGRRTAWVCRSGSGQKVQGVAISRDSGAGAPEAAVQSLWNQYFRSAAIPGKTNLRLQKSRMPEKTWRFLVENPGPLGS